MAFKNIKVAVAKQFQSMVDTGLYRTIVEKDVLWETYLNTFPPGTNPIYKTRTEHDCSCCRHFVKNLGGVVTVKDGKLVTLWDFETGDFYSQVAATMATLVRRHAIDNIFLHPERAIGTSNSRMVVPDSPEVVTWEHFFVNLPPAAHETGLKIGPRLSEARSTHDVMLRSLREIDLDSIDAALDLIRQGSLYRGEENQHAVREFRKLKVAFGKVAQDDADLFVWERIKTQQSIARIRNTAIGTLLTDLAEGRDLEESVKSFEQKVAPMNYKRPTALVTKAMVEKARATVEELGFTTALERRYATIDDLTINNVLFADRTTRPQMNGAFDGLTIRPVSAKSMEKVEDVPVEKFLSEILPRAESVEVMLENRHAANFVSLVAPADPTSKSMFKWSNRFSWSYNGDLADSIKERVKQAGGNVTGDFRASLSWFNRDDLDLHLREPGGNVIHYASKVSLTGGQLDVDMNAGGWLTRSPVENIFYSRRAQMKEGEYALSVNQFSQREKKDVGFDLELEFDGTLHSFSYAKEVRGMIQVARFRYSHAKGMEMIESLPSSVSSKTMWGVQTQAFHKVNVILLSPNHWDGEGVGNKHYFFMLDKCLNEGVARGFFNEFLNAQLEPHRKVLEMVGAKMKTEESDRQLSGIGFSSTQRNSVLCKVGGSFTRTVKVTF